ncbi:MAG: VWA domain-containing protein [Acidobacteriota bacterium]|nr:VWA domain-containing protein [Acidobacteriota bacterium]
MRRPRRDFEVFSLSFLDVICCGFGAIVLLLVLTKIGEPRAIEDARRDLDGRIAALQEELNEIRGQTAVFERRLKGRREQLSTEQAQIARLRGDLENIRGEYAGSRQLSEVQDIMEGRLLAAQQELTEEMKRLLDRSHQRRVEDTAVGGIPIDSEYIIFVIDTSGSMFHYAWPAVVEKMTQVLNTYPKVKGMQVMNDMGQYMYSQYVGKWIPDTPGRRKAVLARLASWNVFSNSSPEEGITRAIRTFASPNHRVSIYVFGDEFTGSSIDKVVRAVDTLNAAGPDGRRRVRIHAIGFPTVFSVGGASQHTGIRFATLMRILCRRNDGTFVALNSTSP